MARSAVSPLWPAPLCLLCGPLHRDSSLSTGAFAFGKATKGILFFQSTKLSGVATHNFRDITDSGKNSLLNAFALRMNEIALVGPEHRVPNSLNLSNRSDTKGAYFTGHSWEISHLVFHCNVLSQWAHIITGRHDWWRRECYNGSCPVGHGNGQPG